MHLFGPPQGKSISKKCSFHGYTLIDLIFHLEASKIHAGVYFSILLVHVQGRQI